MHYQGQHNNQHKGIECDTQHNNALRYAKRRTIKANCIH
jgi:hypothetical protein